MRRRTARLATLGLAVLGAVVVWDLTTWLFPYHSLNHDEAVYLQQAAMLLEGQLALRPPVEDVFRPWFFVEDGGRLYPKYAPIPAAMFAVGKLLGGYWLALVGIAAGNLALVALVVSEVFDRRTGLLAGVIVLASPLFLIDSAVFLPYAPTTLLNLTFAYAYLRSDRTGDSRWAALAGGAIGLAFFARPYTALLFTMPFVVHGIRAVRDTPRESIWRLAPTLGLGLAGVGLTLGYNALMTGSALRFPYEAFAPRDGLGFGRRAILGHEVDYTVELALRANRQIVELFFTKWFAGGIVGTVLAAVGLAEAGARRPTPRTGLLAGIVPSVIIGNIYFWGNLNVLGDIDRAGDGLVAVLGPYYHFDLLLPAAGFAAYGAFAMLERGQRLGTEFRDERTGRVVVAILLVLATVAVGAVTYGNLEEPVEENLDATRTYHDAYQPFETRPPAGSLVLLPTPYGHWLNHPFQPLRNDPGYHGPVVYALNERPFAVAEAFPDRTLYRYVYRGAWAPYAGSPEAARLQPVNEVSGGQARLEATLGIPPGAEGVTARVSTDHGNVHYVASNVTDPLDVRLHLADGRVWLSGDVAPTETGSLAVSGRDVVRLFVFVDYPAGGFTYQFALPVDVSSDQVRVLTPRIEYCLAVQRCGGAAAYIPEAAPDGVFVEAELVAGEHNS
ncbi:MAG: ArnT family glycosyltransferase [Halobacteriales archaeon]